MELVPVEREGRTLTLEVQDEDDTVLNLLKEALLRDDNVKVATYNRRHPALDAPHLTVTVVRGDPSNALKKAVKALRDDLDQFETDFLKATK